MGDGEVEREKPEMGDMETWRLLGAGSERNDIAALVELYIIFATDFDTVKRIVEAVQRQRQSSLSLHIASLAEIVDLVEVVRIAGFLGHTLKMCLTIDFNTHC